RRPHVRRRRSVFDAVAVGGEWIGAGAIDPFAVVLLETREVSVGDRDDLLPRRTLRRCNRLEPEFLYLRLVHSGDVVGAAAARPEVDGFYFRDPSELDAQ